MGASTHPLSILPTKVLRAVGIRLDLLAGNREQIAFLVEGARCACLNGISTIEGDLAVGDSTQVGTQVDARILAARVCQTGAAHKVQVMDFLN